MKQKMVIRVEIKCDKCRTKAMKLVASVAGVASVGVQGEKKDELVLVGDGVDAANLTRCLRKRVGHADLVRVEEVK
ncbi:heavy metal-associated isoprenylated plant protein 47-like [Curcuma longa]|uniref:heavy metal-associated isoprenylated plant protein 47-like n=1 Tax=Curcuma longa TaxID=136217 RepID=UPI003D9EA6E4